MYLFNEIIFFHMLECPDAKYFWSRVAHTQSEIIGVHICCVKMFLLLNDDSALKITLFREVTAIRSDICKEITDSEVEISS